MSKNALVIGGTGFLGSAIVQALQGSNRRVAVLSRGERASELKDIELLTADRSQPGALVKATNGRDWDLVVDCVAYQQAATEDAIAAFAGRTSLYVFISTDFVYAATPRSHYPLTEDADIQCETPYAAGKLDCETVLMKAWQHERFPAVVLRPPHILGATRPLGSDPLEMRVPNLLDEMRAGRELSLLADGQLLIQPVWNREIGACIAHLANNDGDRRGTGHIFNCAGADCITTERYYQIIADYLQVPLRFRSVSIADFVRESPDKVHIARHRCYDHGRLREVTGYEPHHRVEDAIYETARWLDS